jgi:hypothetical protein
MEEVTAGWEKSREVLETIQNVLIVVGDFFSWLGLYAALLIVATLGVLYLLGIVSPLERRVNYLLAVGFGSVVAYISVFPLDAYGRYLIVMGAPLLFSYGLWLLWYGVKHFWTKRTRVKPLEKEATVRQLLESTAAFQSGGDPKRLKTELEGILGTLE